MDEKKEWFETWFDSPYYHILYDHRDEIEAESFILKLKEYLNLNSQDTILDLACGAGRHSAFLSKFAKEVIGVDLSKNSIQQANKSYQSNILEFYTHDMRQPFRINYFDYIFNFFTSFGYFKRKSDNLKVLQSIYKGLRPNGVVVIDFMNVEKTIRNFIRNEIIIKQGIQFHISRSFIDGKIIKQIQFETEKKSYNYTESVQALTSPDFRELFATSGFIVSAEFGDYDLNDFDSINSNRYIIIGKKLSNGKLT